VKRGIAVLLGMTLILAGCAKKQEQPTTGATPHRPRPPCRSRPRRQLRRLSCTRAAAAAKAKITLSGPGPCIPCGQMGGGIPETASEYRRGCVGRCAGKGMADALSGAVDLGMVSREVNQAEKDKGRGVSVVKDAVLRP